MRKLLFIALAGAAAELIDGALGMGFGVTASTVLIAFAGLGAAQASAIVHTAELGTTLASGASHWKFGNVDWGVVLRLGIPGAIGAFAGATILSNISTKAAAPITAGILVAIGVMLLVKFSRGRSTPPAMKQPYNPVFLAGLGVFGGFIDASGGGGWGPVTSSTLMSLGRTEPRRVIGAVNTAEFLVTLAATLGFVFGLWHDLVEHGLAVLGLLVGGVIVAPIAAWLVSRLNPFLLGGIVGTGLIFLNSPKLLALTDFSDGTVWGIRGAVLVIGLGLSALGVWRSHKTGRGEVPVADKEPALEGAR
ncbi:sulfite exporter TauE/SafE family protein [Corynebacterium canis]|uniref:Probable membrane transporter protein n=1 Tax=Corynebacterium canis TaxID=679663 RepID=A0A5C5USY9_9CORY|nr:sulfite exporter TauE/SafE family protein [Corynebacterium canis]TWT28897.1 sulfite exporter TauE/SafE family protein [Corynebacterium canis]WJY75036.1 Sulfite exporter TauE/SafE [Corynebacterium canis]